MQPLQCAAAVVGPEPRAASGLVRWFVGVVVFAGLSIFFEEEAALGNHIAQSPASVQVASLGHTMG